MGTCTARDQAPGAPVVSRRAKARSLTREDAVRLASELYGIEAAARELPSYIDQNFRLDEVGKADRADGAQWVLKIANSDDERDMLDFQNAAMARLAEREPGLAPVVRRSLAGHDIENVTAPDGRCHLVRVLSYLPAGMRPDTASSWTQPATGCPRTRRVF